MAVPPISKIRPIAITLNRFERITDFDSGLRPNDINVPFIDPFNTSPVIHIVDKNTATEAIIRRLFTGFPATF